VGFALAVTATLAMAGERVVLEAIMVRVNDRVITVTDFRERLRQELSQIPEPPTGSDLTGYATALFGTVVDEMVLLERAQEKRLQVEDEAVDSAIAALREDNNLKDDAAFKQALSTAGLTEETLRQRYRQNLLLSRVVQSEVKAAEITEEELRQKYETDKARFAVPARVELEQLSFPTADDGLDRDQVAQRARGLVERVSQGSDLVAEATLAGVEVQQLGSIPISDLRSELTSALEEVPDGGLTAPLDYPGGVQVLRLVRRIPAGYQPFEEIREALRRQRSQEMYQDQTRGLVDRLKQDFLVEAHPELLERALSGLA
jgi:parvulin-like peptidyl-prolyl isomerase